MVGESSERDVSPGGGAPGFEGTRGGDPSRPYTEAHDEVFRILAEAQGQHHGEGVGLGELAGRVGRQREDTLALLRELDTAHGLVTEVHDPHSAESDPRYVIRSGR